MDEIERIEQEAHHIALTSNPPVYKVEIRLPDFNWLISRARENEVLSKKVQELEDERSLQKNQYINDQEMIGHQGAKIHDLEQENQRYKEALVEIQEYVDSTDFSESYWDVFVINKIISKTLKGESE